MDFEVTVIGVGLTRQQRLQFATRDFNFEVTQRSLALRDHRAVFLALAKLDQHYLIVELTFDALD